MIATIWLAAFTAAPPRVCAESWRSIDYPLAKSTTAETMVDGYDNLVAGTYVAQDGTFHGWYRIRFEDMREIVCPGAVSIHPVDISDVGTGEITVFGYYKDSDGIQHGFVYHTDTLVCDTWLYKGDSTAVGGANNKGAAVGRAEAGTFPDSRLSTRPPTLQGIGYYRKPGGKFVTINVPDAQSNVDPTGLNNKNVATGDYDGIGGFVWSLSTQTATEFACANTTITLPAAINAKGVIAGNCGNYTPDTGFVRDAVGNIARFQPQLGRTGYTFFVYPEGINRKDTIAGYFNAEIRYGAPHHDHGFIRTSNGKTKVIDYPGASDTYPLAINDFGIVVGYYYDKNGNQHGFERDP